MRWSYSKKPKSTPKKNLFQLRNEINKVTGLKINKEKSFVLLYIKNELSEGNLKSNPIYNNMKNNKILTNNFNQGGKLSVHWKL